MLYVNVLYNNLLLSEPIFWQEKQIFTLGIHQTIFYF